MLTRAVWAGFVLLTGLASAGLAWSFISLAPTPTPPHTGSPADDLQRTLLADNVGRPGDPVLSAMFVELAARYEFERFTAEADRYNLMVVYPDGLEAADRR